MKLYTFRGWTIVDGGSRQSVIYVNPEHVVAVSKGGNFTSVVTLKETYFTQESAHKIVTGLEAVRNSLILN